MTYAAPGYFAPGYFNAVWRAGAIGPKVIGLVVETIWGEEAANRFLALSRLPAESVQSGEQFHRLLKLARMIDEVTSIPEAVVKLVVTLGAALVMAVSSAVELTELALRPLGRVRRAAALVNLDELTGIWPALGRRLVMVLSRAVQATETKLRLRARLKKIAEALQITELTLYPGLIIRGLVHSGIKLRALISAALRVNKR